MSYYRSLEPSKLVIAFSLSYQRENLLARGLGWEHLRELLIRLARPLLRQGASLAYGGNWAGTEEEGNFTLMLLRLISDEQADNSLAGTALAGPDTSYPIGILYNYLAWPHYLPITPKLEAQWLKSCRIVRVEQEAAGFAGEDLVADADRYYLGSRAPLNAAVTMSAMRRLMMQGTKTAPPATAMILLGGKEKGYSGFAPGIFEEALMTWEHQRPLYLLGGFGGAAEVLAQAILSPDSACPEKLTPEWHLQQTPGLANLLALVEQHELPSTYRSPQSLLQALFIFVQEARAQPAATLRTGLTDEETRDLLGTRDVTQVVRLVRKGLTQTNNLPQLAA